MLDKIELNKIKKAGIVTQVIQSCEKEAFCFVGAINSKTLLEAFGYDLETELGRKVELEVALLLTDYTDYNEQERGYIDLHKFARVNLGQNTEVKIPLSRFTYNPVMLFRALDELIELFK